jgi:hypothetical protein
MLVAPGELDWQLPYLYAISGQKLRTGWLKKLLNRYKRR